LALYAWWVRRRRPATTAKPPDDAAQPPLAIEMGEGETGKPTIYEILGDAERRVSCSIKDFFHLFYIFF
jgi:hypothetical protein